MNIIFNKIFFLTSISDKSSDDFVNHFMELVDLIGKKNHMENLNNVDELGNSISCLIYNLYELHRVTCIYHKKQNIPTNYMKDIFVFLNKNNADFSLTNLKKQNLYSLMLHYNNWELLLFISQLNSKLFMKEYINLKIYQKIRTFEFLLGINNLDLSLESAESYTSLVDLNGLEKVFNFIEYLKEKRVVLSLIK